MVEEGRTPLQRRRSRRWTLRGAAGLSDKIEPAASLPKRWSAWPLSFSRPKFGFSLRVHRKALSRSHFPLSKVPHLHGSFAPNKMEGLSKNPFPFFSCGIHAETSLNAADIVFPHRGLRLGSSPLFPGHDLQCTCLSTPADPVEDDKIFFQALSLPVLGSESKWQETPKIIV